MSFQPNPYVPPDSVPAQDPPQTPHKKVFEEKAKEEQATAASQNMPTGEEQE